MVERSKPEQSPPRHEWIVTSRQPISITDLCGGKLPSRRDLSDWSGYEEVARKPLYGFHFKTADEKHHEYVIVGPAVTASEANGLLYAAAPDKFFGLDTGDILADWKDLYGKDKEHIDRLNRHSSMPGWKAFENSKDRVYRLIEQNYDSQYGIFDDNPDDTITPVLRWRTENGKRIVSIDPLPEDTVDHLQYLVPFNLRDPEVMDIGMGVMLLAAYSPEQSGWDMNAKYRDNSQWRDQPIGATQVMAYAFRKLAEAQKNPGSVIPAHDIQTSPLLAALETYVDTGAIAAIAKPDPQVEPPTVREIHAPYETVLGFIGGTNAPITSVELYKKPEN